MISQIASVFSSQGVVLPDTELVPVPGLRGAEDAGQVGQAAPSRGDFQSLFDQAAAKLELSGRALKAAEEAAGKKSAAPGEEEGGPDPDAPAAGEASSGTGGTGRAGSSTRLSAPGIDDLTPEERKIVEKLKERDREVRSHEQAHIASSGGHARGGPRYEFQTGPDGKQYAVGGHVNIDMSPVSGNPQATLQKAMAVRRAATAPGEPSGADMAVAAAAAEMARQAGKELAASRGAGAAAAGGADRPGGPEGRRAAAAFPAGPHAAYAAAAGRADRERMAAGRFVDAIA